MTRRIGGHFTFDEEAANSHYAASGANLITTPARIAEGYSAKCFQMFIGPSRGYEPYIVSQDTAAAFNALKGKDGLVAAHGPYLPNVCSSERWEESVASIVKYMRTADSLGIEFLVFHPGSHKGEGANYGQELFIQATRSIVEQTSNLRTKLLWENTAGGGTQVGHVEVVAQVVREVGPDKVGMCVDTTHSFADGHNLEDRCYRDEFWAKYRDITNWVHFNNPDRKVMLGSHLDRHRQDWLQARWPVDVMLEIAEDWGSFVPLCMEADPKSYSVNFMLLDEVGLI